MSASTKENTTLVFNKGSDLIIDISLDNFYDGAGSLESVTNPSVTLTSPDEYTATYNVYLEISTNTFIYTTEEESPELLLNVYDEFGEEVKSIAGLEYVEYKGNSGFDITVKDGLFVISSLNMITTDSETTEEWEFVVSFINLETDQFFNSGKLLEANISLQDVIDDVGILCDGVSCSSKEFSKNVEFTASLMDELNNAKVVWFNDSGLYNEVNDLVSNSEGTKFSANIETELDNEVINLLVINNYGEKNEQIYTTKTNIGFDKTPPTIISVTVSNDETNILTIVATDEGSNIMGHKVVESSSDCSASDLTNLPIKLISSTANKVCVYDSEENFAEEILDLAKITYLYEAPAQDNWSYMVIDTTNSYNLLEQNDLEGYLIDGWYSGNVKYTSSSKITSDVQLIAKYDQTLYSAMLTNDGVGYSTLTDAIKSIDAKSPNFSRTSTTNEGLNSINDSYGTSYYYRGAVDNNWVKFGKEDGKDIYWRIIRIEGNKNIKLIYSGTTAPTSEESVAMTGDGTQVGTVEFNKINTSMEYVGYVYELGKQHGISTDSDLKIFVDNWYEETLSSSYGNYIVPHDVCIDRVTYSRTGEAGSYIYSKNSIQEVSYDVNYYGATSRLEYLEDEAPSLLCEVADDKLTLNASLISADEISLAGGLRGYANSLYYLYTGKTYWSISPTAYTGTSSSVYRVEIAGGLSGNHVKYDTGVRVVISVSPLLISISGDGTYNNPYIFN